MSEDIPSQMLEMARRARAIEQGDFAGLPIETGPVRRGFDADQFSDHELLAYVARHRSGDFGEYGQFDDCQITDRNRRGDIEHLSHGQMNRQRIELRLPDEIRSKYQTQKGTLYVSTLTSCTEGRATYVYGPEGL